MESEIKSTGMNLVKLIDQDLQVNGIIETSIKLGIFELLKLEYHTLSEIKNKCGLKINERNLFDFLDILYFNGHLLREGKDLENAKYRNAHSFFNTDNPDNLIPLIGMKDRFMRRYRDLPFIIKENENPKDVSATFVEIFSNEHKAKDFLWTMALLQNNNFKTLAKGIDFNSYKRLLDVGGCLGAFCLHIKSLNPNLECSSLDLPFVEVYARQYLRERNMEDQIKLISGDMFSEQLFPQSDVISFGNILHDWNEEKKKFLLKKAYNSLNEGGIVIVVEHFISNERNVYDAASCMSFHMLLETIEGYNMTQREMELYAYEAGFSKVEFLYELLGVDAAIIFK